MVEAVCKAVVVRKPSTSNMQIFKYVSNGKYMLHMDLHVINKVEVAPLYFIPQFVFLSLPISNYQ